MYRCASLFLRPSQLQILQLNVAPRSHWYRITSKINCTLYPRDHRRLYADNVSSNVSKSLAMPYRIMKRVFATSLFLWVLSKGSWGFIDDIQFVQGTKEEFGRFMPRSLKEDENKEQLKVIKDAFKQPIWRKVTNFFLEEINSRWFQGVSKLLPLGDVTSGNRVEIFVNGDNYVRDVWDAIRNAKHRVWVEMFTIRNDRVGQTTLKLLQEAAARGVDVVFIYDYIGSLGFDPGPELVEMENACVAVYNPVFPLWRKVGPTMGRDHRKVIIIDDIGYCGGRNLTENYAGPEFGAQNAYHDISVKLQGPCVGDLARAVLATLYQIKPDLAACRAIPMRLALDGKEYVDNTIEDHSDSGVLIQILRQNARHHLRSIDKAVRIILREVATEQCFITTPYFMPTAKLRRDLIKASRNGVDVRILTMGKPLTIQEDVVVNFLQAHAHHHIYGKFLTEGVRIFEDQAALHSKTITVDGNLAVVGSFNFDSWSARRNQEITAAMLDHDTAKTLENIFLDRCKNAKEITLDKWQDRTLSQVFLDWICFHVVAFASLDSLCVYRQKEEELTVDAEESRFVRYVMEEAFEQAY